MLRVAGDGEGSQKERIKAAGCFVNGLREETSGIKEIRKGGRQKRIKGPWNFLRAGRTGKQSLGALSAE